MYNHISFTTSTGGVVIGGRVTAKWQRLKLPIYMSVRNKSDIIFGDIVSSPHWSLPISHNTFYAKISQTSVFVIIWPFWGEQGLGCNRFISQSSHVSIHHKGVVDSYDFTVRIPILSERYLFTGMRPGPVFCLLLGVSPGCARPITGQVISITWPVICWA